MLSKFEQNYVALVQRVLREGDFRTCRNANTRSIFGPQLVVPNVDYWAPILTGRKMYTKGILGELAAMLRGPQNVADFERWGCNYWKQWADESGNLNLDYGNAWLEGGQIERLKDCLANNRTDRRMLINGWVPEHLPQLSLPCCHYSYQFYVSNNTVLDMVWNQRSADLMIGVPSDAVFAAAWLKAIANEFGLMAGTIYMNLGDTHIYESHVEGAQTYLQQAAWAEFNCLMPTWTLTLPAGKDFLEFEPSDLEITYEQHAAPIKLELHS